MPRTQYRCNLHAFLTLSIKLKRKFTAAHIKELRKTPFWDLISSFWNCLVCDSKKSDTLLSEVLKHYNPQLKCFQIGCATASIEASDVERILGLPRGGEEMKISGGRRPQSTFFERNFRGFSGRLSKTVIEDRLEKALGKKTEDGIKDAVCLLIMHLCATMLFSNSGFTLQWNFVRHCEDLKGMKNKAWAKAVLDFMNKGLKKNNGKMSSSNGCFILILFWLCEKTTLTRPIKGREDLTPTLVKWDLDDLTNKLGAVDFTQIQLIEEKKLKVGKTNRAEGKEREMQNLEEPDDSFDYNCTLKSWLNGKDKEKEAGSEDGNTNIKSLTEEVKKLQNELDKKDKEIIDLKKEVIYYRKIVESFESKQKLSLEEDMNMLADLMKVEEELQKTRNENNDPNVESTPISVNSSHHNDPTNSPRSHISIYSSNIKDPKNSPRSRISIYSSNIKDPKNSPVSQMIACYAQRIKSAQGNSSVVYGKKRKVENEAVDKPKPKKGRIAWRYALVFQTLSKEEQDKFKHYWITAPTDALFWAGINEYMLREEMEALVTDSAISSNTVDCYMKLLDEELHKVGILDQSFISCLAWKHTRDRNASGMNMHLSIPLLRSLGSSNQIFFPLLIEEEFHFTLLVFHKLEMRWVHMNPFLNRTRESNDVCFRNAVLLKQEVENWMANIYEKGPEMLKTWERDEKEFITVEWLMTKENFEFPIENDLHCPQQDPTSVDCGPMILYYMQTMSRRQPFEEHIYRSFMQGYRGDIIRTLMNHSNSWCAKNTNN